MSIAPYHCEKILNAVVAQPAMFGGEVLCGERDRVQRGTKFVAELLPEKRSSPGILAMSGHVDEGENGAMAPERIGDRTDSQKEVEATLSEGEAYLARIRPAFSAIERAPP